MTDIKKIKFRTVLKPIKFKVEMKHQSKSIFFGSCFTENIGSLLIENKFKVDINPFGILYNPLSIHKSINFLIEEKKISEEHIFFFNERWHSFMHHSRFSGTNKTSMLEDINAKIKDSSQFLKEADFLFLTLGTSWVFENIETEEVVSNCHKLPASNFKRRLLQFDEITDSYNKLITKLQSFNKNLKVVFTISPVRHLKDGFSENNLSKSILKVAIEKLVFTHLNCFYFPAYEIMMDDLRDYRFYEDDLLHPSNEAIKYIFNYFSNTFFSNETIELYEKINKISIAIKHKPFNPNSDEYRKFALNNIEKIKQIKKEFPFLDFEEEIMLFSK